MHIHLALPKHCGMRRPFGDLGSGGMRLGCVGTCLLSCWYEAVHMIPVSVNERLLSSQPLPCNPVAEIALHPLIVCFASLAYLPKTHLLWDICSQTLVCHTTIHTMRTRCADQLHSETRSRRAAA